MLPDHAPDAVHAVAFMLDHVSVELAPDVTELGLAEIVTLTGGPATLLLLSCLQPATVSASSTITHRNGVAGKVCMWC